MVLNADYALNEGVFGFHYDPKYSTRRLRGHLAKVRRSNEVVLYSDAKLRSSPAASFMPDPWLVWTPALTSTGPVTLADALDNNGKALDAYSFDRIRHRGRMNIAFADGHVAAYRITSPETARRVPAAALNSPRAAPLSLEGSASADGLLLLILMRE